MKGGIMSAFMLLALFGVNLLWPPSEAKVELVDHGYEGIVIAINPYLKQEERMLKKLEMYLTATSETLFRATRRQLYFREFIVVIPETWKGMKRHENALDVQLDRAQIIIDQGNPAYGDAPYVKQYAECGQPGLYIHLTPQYLLDDDVIHKWGQPEKTLVHEWAHLRWGLFDEYPIDAQDLEFYRYNGVWQPTRCTSDVEGSVINEFTSKPCSFDYFSGKPEPACRFFPRMKTNQARASLMFMQYLESIVEFCDDPASAPRPLRHNYLAPNRQNRLCSYKSAWEVMRKHEDFKSATSSPLPEGTDTRPRFRYVQVQPRKRALVLDTSGSMTGSSLSVMMRAASNYILSCIENGSKLGIVQFNTNATQLTPLIQINKETDRQALIKALPRQADGKTSIGAGLEKGLRILDSMDDGLGGTIILITDGRENERPFLSDYRVELQAKGVVVHSLAYGQRAEESIAELSKQTGGKTFFYSGRKDSTALIDGLAATIFDDQSISKSSASVSLITEAKTVLRGIPLVGTFLVDSTVGAETSLTISYSEPIEVTVVGPHGANVTNETHPELYQLDEVTGVLKILLPGLAESGVWQYIVDTNESESHVIVSVQSRSRRTGGDVLTISSWLPEQNVIAFDPKQKLGIFAEVLRGRAPVLKAEVVAEIERPETTSVEIPLYDNGIGSDVIKDDGIYAAYLLATDLTGDGHYSIKIKARAVDGVTQVVTGGKGSSSGALRLTSSGEKIELITEAVEKFQRVTTAGEFRVTDFPASLQTVPDLIAPSRITDLRVVSLDLDNGTTVLEWTAVGDDMDRGQAKLYKMFVSTDKELFTTAEVNDSVWSVADDILFNSSKVHPKPAGQSEHITISLNRRLGKNNTLLLSITAIDESGNIGELSNIVTVSRARELAVPMGESPSDSGVKFYVTLILPPMATILLFVGLILMLIMARRSSKAAMLNAHINTALSASTCSLDFSNMNYRTEGKYRKRQHEDEETWSRDGLDLEDSRENLDTAR